MQSSKELREKRVTKSAIPLTTEDKTLLNFYRNENDKLKYYS